jgi:nicotinamide-nucleotide amidase
MMRPLETAEVLAVGSELLTPYRIDTNSLFVTERLNDIGIVVRGKAVVGDVRADLAIRLREALARVDVVVTSGGLGPTDDDVTRDVVADVLGRTMRVDQRLLEGVEARFARRGWTMPAINRRQANVPEGATVLPNPNGTAPGLLLDVDGRIVVLLPGPPRELRPMMESSVLPILRPRTGGRRVYRRVIKVTGRSESQVEEIAHPIYSTLSGDVAVETTILAMPGQIELHLSAPGNDPDAVAEILDRGVAALAAALGDPVFSTDGRSLEAVVGEALRARGWRVAVAESCTGGLLGGRLTEVPGSSDYVAGGVIAYDNAVKQRELCVDAGLLERHGAVSEEVARAMAEGVRARFEVEVGAAITGIAGPGGGTPAKPVGMVCVAVVTPRRLLGRTFQFPGDREAIRRHATAAALELIRRELQG